MRGHGAEFQTCRLKHNHRQRCQSQADHNQRSGSQEVLRHSAAHVMAQAVLHLYKDAKLTIGPAVEDGFYYDIDMEPVSKDDFEKIEAEMKKAIKAKIPFRARESSQNPRHGILQRRTVQTRNDFGTGGRYDFILQTRRFYGSVPWPASSPYRIYQGRKADESLRRILAGGSDKGTASENIRYGIFLQKRAG